MVSAQMLAIAAELAKTSPPIDRLAYSEAFEGPNGVHEQYIQRLGRPCSKRDTLDALLHARKLGLVGASRRRSRRGSP